MPAPVNLLDVHAIDQRDCIERNVNERKDSNLFSRSVPFKLSNAGCAYRFSLDNCQQICGTTDGELATSPAFVDLVIRQLDRSPAFLYDKSLAWSWKFCGSLSPVD